MLDWEMQEQEIPILPIFQLPYLNREEQHLHAQIQNGNNYSSYNKIHHINLEVLNRFSCLAS